MGGCCRISLCSCSQMKCPLTRGDGKQVRRAMRLGLQSPQPWQVAPQEVIDSRCPWHRAPLSSILLDLQPPAHQWDCRHSLFIRSRANSEVGSPGATDPDMVLVLTVHPPSSAGSLLRTFSMARSRAPIPTYHLCGHYLSVIAPPEASSTPRAQVEPPQENKWSEQEREQARGVAQSNCSIQVTLRPRAWACSSVDEAQTMELGVHLARTV